MKYTHIMNCFYRMSLGVKLSFVLVFFALNFFAQSLSPEYIRSLKVNELSTKDVENIKSQMDKQNVSLAALENLAISNGMSPTDFSILKTRIESLSPEVKESNVEKGTPISEKPIEMDKTGSGISKSEIYGSEFFANSALNFEPNASSMATPSNYILGPGDEMQIVIYGMQEFAGSAAVSKEGRITLPVVGQIYVNGLTFEAARVQIKKAAGKIYTSLNSGQSVLSVSLSKIKTIKVTIIGAQRPGNYSVSSLSTVYNALHVAGGPDANGSYRNIELIRNNKVIRKIDIYKFLTTGDQSDNINVMENDVIRIPVYENRVKIEGKVKRPGVFELLPNESFKDLLVYCGGFDESAYRENVKLIQNTHKELRIVDLSEADYENYVPNSGDVFKVSEILGRFENKVSIRGAVFRPDDYAYVKGMTVRDLINKAAGLKGDVFKNRALLIREKEDLTKEITTINLTDSSYNIELRKNDELVISSIFDLQNQHTVEIYGKVKNPGEFPYIENLTLYDLILQAGGFTESSSRMVEISRVIIKDEKVEDQQEKSKIFHLEIDTLLMDQSRNFVLAPYDVVQIRKKPVFEMQHNVAVYGQVYYPGSYTISNDNERFLDLMERAGGLRSDANINAISILRNSDRTSTEHVESIPRIIAINYRKASNRPDSPHNIILKPGDQIMVRKVEKTVQVVGNVFLNSETIYVPGKNLKYYVDAVGGFNESTDKKKIYVVEANGFAKTTKNFLFFRKYPKITAGSEIYVPKKQETVNNGNKLSITELAVISGVIGSLTGMTIAIINLLKE